MPGKQLTLAFFHQHAGSESAPPVSEPVSKPVEESIKKPTKKPTKKRQTIKKPRNPLMAQTKHPRTKRPRSSLHDALAFAEDRAACKAGTLGAPRKEVEAPGEMAKRWALAPAIGDVC